MNESPAAVTTPPPAPQPPYLHLATTSPGPTAQRPPSLLAVRAVSSAALLMAALWVLAGCSGSEANTQQAPAAVVVGVQTVQAQVLPVSTELAGRTVAADSAEIRPQTTALVKARLFREGANVKAGELLYQLDDASAQASLRSAQASVAKARATLAAAELKARRTQALLEADAGTRQDQEDAQAALLQAQADLQVALATQANAQIELDHTRIRSPMSGRVDTSTVSPGALVTASQTTALTTVQKLDPIWVDLPQSSTELLALRQRLSAGTLQGGSAEVQLTLEDGSRYPLSGRLQVQGVAVDTGTGAVTLRAQFPNPQGLLLPGMFVRARLAQGTDPAALLIPQAAVQRNDRGEATTWVVDEQGKVESRKLTVAEGTRGQWRVLQGLKAGERVVVEGSAKVRAGQLVQAVPAAAAASAASAASASAPAAASAASASGQGA